MVTRIVGHTHSNNSSEVEKNFLFYNNEIRKENTTNPISLYNVTVDTLVHYFCHGRNRNDSFNVPTWAIDSINTFCYYKAEYNHTLINNRRVVTKKYINIFNKVISYLTN